MNKDELREALGYMELNRRFCSECSHPWNMHCEYGCMVTPTGKIKDIDFCVCKVSYPNSFLTVVERYQAQRHAT